MKTKYEVEEVYGNFPFVVAAEKVFRLALCGFLSKDDAELFIAMKQRIKEQPEVADAIRYGIKKAMSHDVGDLTIDYYTINKPSEDNYAEK